MLFLTSYLYILFANLALSLIKLIIFLSPVTSEKEISHYYAKISKLSFW